MDPSQNTRNDYSHLRSWREVKDVLDQLDVSRVDLARRASISEGTFYRGVRHNRLMQRSTRKVVVAALTDFLEEKRCS